MKRFKIVFLLAAGGLLATAAFAAPSAFANVAPSCPDTDHTVVSGGALQLQGHCTDPDGPNALSYSIVNGPSSGTLSGSPNGSATYRSFVGFEGDDSFTYRANDGLANSNTATVTIHVTSAAGNQPPECPDTNVFVQSGGSVTLSANCTDPDGPGPISYGLGPGPTGGQLICCGPGPSVTYTPNSGTTSDSFVYTATDGIHPTISVTVHIDVTSPGAGTFETAPEATPSEPYVASVTTTQSGPVTIDAREVTSTPPDGFFLLNQEFDITAPNATNATNPLRLAFTIDSSNVPGGAVTVFRDGTAVGDCTGPSGVADPDPCVEDATVDGNGDLRITVLSTHASLWNLGVATAYDFSGFFRPVDNPPTLNVTKAGSAIPVKFSLNGDQGLDVLADGYPKSHQIDCNSADELDDIESTVTAGSSALSYDAAADQYSYVWKTSKEWAGTCRQLVLQFDDPAHSTERANFKFTSR